jgi:proteasome assembly chaperone (PAC2) family protein
MSTSIHWMNEVGLPPHRLILEAVPGVGNVGKLVLDTLIETEESALLARILHPDLPPHSTLEDGLLVPPHLSIHSVKVKNQTLITITGMGQPMTPRGQHELAEAILELAEESGTEMLLVLAGLSAEPGDDGVHITCSSSEVKSALNEAGVAVSDEQPAGGMLGLAGLIASLAPLHDVPSAAVIAETIGTSVDVMAADRLAKRISTDFGLEFDLPIDNTRETAAKILSLMEGKEIAGIDLADEESGGGFYA